MKRGIVVGLVFMIFCLSFINGAGSSDINQMFCGKGGIISPSIKCFGDLTNISPVECLNISEYSLLNKWDENGVSGYSKSYFEYKNGEISNDEEFCRKVNTNYCSYSCIDETKKTAETGRFRVSSESEVIISEKEFNLDVPVCGDGICEELLEEGFYCTEREDRTTKEYREMVKEKYPNIDYEIEEYSFDKSCIPSCYQDCGYIIKNSGKESPQDLIQIPFADLEGSVVTPIYFNGIECLNSGLCLDKLDESGAEISYKGDKFSLPYYKSYNYEVDVLEGEDRYLFLTYNYLFEIKKSGNPVILFFKQFIV